MVSRFPRSTLCPFSFWVPFLTPNSRNKGTLNIIKELLGNLAGRRGGLGFLLLQVRGFCEEGYSLYRIPIYLCIYVCMYVYIYIHMYVSAGSECRTRLAVAKVTPITTIDPYYGSLTSISEAGT